MTDKIQRQVHYLATQAFDGEDTSGANNTWNYNRAPEGYLFELESFIVSAPRVSVVLGILGEGIVTLFDGHEYTHWNIFPGVQSNEVLARVEITDPMLNFVEFLHGWECKEYSIGIRSNSSTYGFKSMVIIYYHLKKASRMELLEYALKHPIREDTFKRALRGTTVEPSEAND